MSTSHHDQNPEIQRQDLQRYCDARGWQVVEELIDHGYSGGSTKRPGLARVLELARSRKIDGIVTTKLDRLFRSLKHLITTLEEFESLGVAFIAIKDPVDWTTATGKFFTQVLGCLAEFEKALIRERTLAGVEFARRKGKVLGRPRNKSWRDIQRLRCEGQSYRAIQGKLGVPLGTIHRALKGVPKGSAKIDSPNSTNLGS